MSQRLVAAEEARQEARHGRRLRAAFGIFLAVGLLASLVAAQGYADARVRLGHDFARQQALSSRRTAQRLRSLHAAAQGAAEELAGRLSDRQATDALAERLPALLGGAVAAYQFAGDGALLGRWPAAAPPPAGPGFAEARRFARDGVDQPSFARHGAAVSVLVARPLQSGVLVVALDLQAELQPPVDPEARHEAAVLLVDSRQLRILGASVPLAEDARFGALFEPSDEELYKAISGGYSATDVAATATAAWPGESGVPHLVGVEGVRLGERTVSVVTVLPRAALVDDFLRELLGWLIRLGAVLIVGLASFVGLVSRERAAARQEQKRLEERDALYRISQSLVSMGTLEEILDTITEQARELFLAEGATIALLDEATDQLVFRAVSTAQPEARRALHGLRLPRDEGLLGWVVSHCETALVNDTSADPRFDAAVDQQTGMSTKALLCAPLIDESGRCFGAIELVNKLEDPFPASDVPLLQNLAVTAAAAVQRAVYQQREAERDRLRREMELAQTVQQSLLPRSFPTIPGFDLHGDNYPAREVGGDFFDFINVTERHLGVVIADVADKGLGAAMFMVLCRSLLYSVAIGELNPARVLERLNALILGISNSDLFVTVFYAVLDTSSGVLHYSNAGHNPPYLSRAADGQCLPLTVPGMALGVIEPLTFRDGAVELCPGDLLVMYTDGVPDSISADGEAFGTERLRELLGASVRASEAAESACRRILTAVDQFVGGEDQFDDITLAIVRASERAREPVDLIEEARLRG